MVHNIIHFPLNTSIGHVMCQEVLADYPAFVFFSSELSNNGNF